MQAYLMILQDPSLIEETIKIIEKEKCNSSYAVEIGLNKIIKTFEEMDDPYMSARSRDIEDMKKKNIIEIIKNTRSRFIKLTTKYHISSKRTSNIRHSKIKFKKCSWNYHRNRWSKFTYGNNGKNT